MYNQTAGKLNEQQYDHIKPEWTDNFIIAILSILLEHRTGVYTDINLIGKAMEKDADIKYISE